ncbi:uncharacterized protein VTP21DRAFT_6451 [Calcarisporiella thermophila]|uniref:uncharacterized protein n=1 Tax=Calcarisporiella thermophila TaxID=911321 RepID=UPI003743CA3A
MSREHHEESGESHIEGANKGLALRHDRQNPSASPLDSSQQSTMQSTSHPLAQSDTTSPHDAGASSSNRNAPNTILRQVSSSTLDRQQLRLPFQLTPTENSRRVRGNWFEYLAATFRQSSRSSKLFLSIVVIGTVCQAIATIVILSITANSECDKPLRAFQIAWLVRSMIACPLEVASHVNEQHRRRGDRSVRLLRLILFVNRSQSTLYIIGAFLFVFGNYYFYTSTTCVETAPPLYYLTLEVLILGYIVIALPVLMWTAIIFCMPCVLILMWSFYVGDAVGMTGASPDAISKIPLMRYRAPDSTTGAGGEEQPRIAPDTDAASSIELSLSSTRPQPSTHSIPRPPSAAPNPNPARDGQRLRWISGIFRRKPERRPQSSLSSASQEITGYLEIGNPEDATCAICLASYRDMEVLRVMLCGHHFHKECLDHWLPLNARCPLCKRNLTGEVEERESAEQRESVPRGVVNLV